jgi:phosphate-selective porin OprO/OprP
MTRRTIGSLLLFSVVWFGATAKAQVATPVDHTSQAPQTSGSLEIQLQQMQQRMEQYEHEIQFRRQGGPTGQLVNWSDSVLGGPEQVDIITKPTHKIRGRLFFDHVAFDDSPALGVDRENETGFDTARMGMQGNVFENVKYQIEVEFEGTEVDFKTVYMEVNHLPWLGNIRVGHFYEPISGLEEVSGSRYQMFMERALPTSAFNPSRSYGYMAWNYLESHDVYWAVGGFRHESDDSPAKAGLIKGDSGDWVMTSRVAWTPYYDEPSDGRYLMHFGLGYSYRTDAEQVLIGTISELGNQAGFLASTIPADQNYSLFVPEFLTIWGPLSLQSEFYYAAPGNNVSLWGGYVEASWFLTGDHRGYNREQKHLTRPRVFEDFFRVRTPSGICRGTGAWELKARWSHVDLSEGSDPNPAVTTRTRGIQSNFLTGVNWYLNAYTRVMFDYVYEDVDLVSGVSGRTHSYGTRMQVQW